LDSIEAITNKESVAATLASQGYTIDVPIQVFGWGAFNAMSQRLSAGMTWVPSALQQPLGAPGGVALPGITTFPGQTVYDPANPPAGAIRVSTNVADYPPFDKPVDPAVQSVVNPIGPKIVGNLYLTVVGDQRPDAATYEDARGKFVKHVTPPPFSHSWWEKTA
jgi:hypothetical protein